ncbi:MAG: calcium-translocating P-type ATPase, PMCA-type [Victivallales bacterium]|nr:calcium-translocating P-type ATPase, PMCA-type [Victivallales bacterium]
MRFSGLTSQQVEESRRRHGSNALTELAPESLLVRFLAGFREPMIMILLVALLVQAALFFCGKAAWYEPFGILTAILIANGVAALFEHRQEGKAALLRHAENALASAKVVRESQLLEVPQDDVVVGDVVFLQTGDKIPADGIVLDGELKVDQAALNGESEEAVKHALPSGVAYNPKDTFDPYYLYRGTVIGNGEAYLEVKVVGDQTEFGQAALGAQEATRQTPLQVKLGRLARQISRFGYVGAGAILAIVLGVTVFSGKTPQDWAGWVRLVLDAVTVAVTIIVCAVPEGLPMLSSILQAVQSLKMVKDHVLVRKIHGLETSGSLSILFCDKTGTITEGRLSVAELATATQGGCQSFAELPAALREEMRIGIGLNNSAMMGKDKAVIGGNGTDRALLAFLLAQGLGGVLSRDEVVSARPFDSVRKSSSVVVRRGKTVECFVKGAPERLLERCKTYLDAEGSRRPLTEEDAMRLGRYLDAQAARSMRLLAVAKCEGGLEDVPLTLVGILCIRDNVRKEAKKAIEEIRQAGIQMVMVTGDRRETALAIAREAGLLTTSEEVALTSSEMASLSDDDLKELLPRLRVVSRALPLDKSRLVRIAQELNLVVGMTGDGVNDSPALRKADVGFAMGSGTEVAKAAGEITILDDNLASIEKAVLYGRTMFKCIRKFLVFQLTVNVAAVFICAIGPVFGVNVVMTVIQLLLVNLAMDTLAALAFGSEPPLAEYMREKPVARGQSIITGTMLAQIGVQACYVTVICLAVLFVPAVRRFISAADASADYLHSALFATFMMAITANGFNARTAHLNPFEGMTRNWTFLAVMALIFAMQFVFVTFGGEALAVTPLSAVTWMKCLFLAFLVIPLEVLRRLAMRGRDGGNMKKQETT